MKASRVFSFALLLSLEAVATSVFAQRAGDNEIKMEQSIPEVMLDSLKKQYPELNSLESIRVSMMTES